MNENFLRAVHFVLMHESVFAPGHDGDLAHVVTEDVPGDSGGLTKYGIDQASHPHVDIRGLTLDAAIAIYRGGEWAKCRCEDLPEGFDVVVFDIAVNNGVGTAVRILQRAVGVDVDGFIGPKTIAAAISGGRDALKRMLIARQSHYYDIVTWHPGDAKFLKGWLNRNNDLCAFVGIQPTSLA